MKRVTKQEHKNKKAGKGPSWKNSQNRTSRTEQQKKLDSQERTVGTGKSEQDNEDRTAQA